MFGLKKVLAFGASSLMAFGGVSLADEAKVANEGAEVKAVVKTDDLGNSAQVKGVVRGTVEFVVPFGSEEKKADEVANVAPEAPVVKAE